MSFLTEIQNPNSKKIVLAEIDIPIANETLINHEAGIWSTLLTSNGVTIEGSSYEEGYYEVSNLTVHFIQSVIVDDVTYLKVDSIVDLRSQTEAFYYDFNNRTIYIHFTESDWPLDRVVRLGAVNGFCNEVDQQNGCYYNEVYYDPRLINVPSLKKSKDPLFFGLLKYQPASVTFNNADGYFDYYENKDVFGQPFRTKLGFEGLEYDEFELVYTGFIEDFNYGFDVFNLRAMDNRKKLSRTLPIRRFSQSQYADLLDDDIDRVKPLAYGVITNAPCILIDEDTNYEFMFMDTTDHDAAALTAVYVNGVEVTPDSSDLSAGTFVVLDADFDDGDEVTADFTGASTDNGLDVISDLLDIYSNIKYNSYNYNTTEWTEEKSNVKDVGLYIGEKIKISDIIEKICLSCDVLFFSQDDGLFTARTWDITRVLSKVIISDEWILNPKKKLNSKEFLTSVEIKYNKNQNTDKYQTITNDDYDEEVFERFKVREEKTYETILTNETDADDKSETVMGISKELYPTISRNTKLQNIDLEIMDFIYAEHDRESTTPKNWLVYEVIGKTINLLNYEVLFDLKVVDTIPIFSGIVSENKYCVQGNPLTTGIMLDALNSAGGTVPDGFGPFYGSGLYGGDTYSLNAFYESDLLISDGVEELTSITITAVGTKVNFQHRTYDGFDFSDWSDPVDTLGTVVHAISGFNVQVRFIFGSELWSDNDSAKIDEVV